MVRSQFGGCLCAFVHAVVHKAENELGDHGDDNDDTEQLVSIVIASRSVWGLSKDCVKFRASTNLLYIVAAYTPSMTPTIATTADNV